MFDFSALDRALEQSPLPVSAFKDILSEGSSLILDLFDKRPIAELVSARAHLIDEILKRSWHAIFSDFSDTSLIAVGGFGRGELHPASDIDLMILLGHENHFAELKERLEHWSRSRTKCTHHRGLHQGSRTGHQRHHQSG